MMIVRLLLHLSVLLFMVDGFVPKTSTSFISARSDLDKLTTSTTTRLWDSNQGESQQDKLARLGYNDQELQERRSEDPEVNVNLIPDVDAATLTAVGFALIGFNFFVLANMGDGGLGGLIARIINTLNEL